MPKSRYVVGFITAPPGRKTEKLARGLVENKLVACVNVVPAVQSFYRWRNKVQKDNESLLIIKSTAARTKKIQTYIQQRHPYDCPELIFLPITAGLKPYLQWVDEETR